MSLDKLNPKFWQKVSRQILSLMKNRARPILLGEVCQEVKIGINAAEKFILSLIEMNLVRVIDGGLSPKYVLVNPQVIPMGDWDTIPLSTVGDAPK